MPHIGISFAIAVGVALGAFIYYLLPSNWELQQEEEYHSFRRNPRAIRDSNVSDNSWRANSEQSTNTRQRCINNGYCSICLNAIKELSEKVKKLECGHAFHDHCISIWFRQKSQCPNCRMQVGITHSE